MDNTYLSQEQFEDIFKSHLKIETFSRSIESLTSPRTLRKIDYKPYYQRNYVWDNNKASYFIESILLGTEIPPIIFFNDGEKIEVIDGRQRFETIIKFINGEIKLTRKGLASLKFLKDSKIDNLDDSILNSFLDSTLRIISFEIVNEPRLDPLLQDKVKKEIFGRYNTGITPLKKYEIDNAVYNDDELTNIFKDELKTNKELFDTFDDLFFKDRKGSTISVENILQFVRQQLVLYKVPASYYAQARKKEVLERLYEQLTDSQSDQEPFYLAFVSKIEIVRQFKTELLKTGIEYHRLYGECLLWALHIIENEELNTKNSDNIIASFIEHIKVNNTDYDTETDVTFYGPVTTRYRSTATFLELFYDADLSIYKSSTDETKKNVKELMVDEECGAKIEELQSLRLNKPEPTRFLIEDIIKQMQRRKFLVRPPYQRAEVINLPKASAIIESVLLGISLPALFIYKRDNDVSEVIDGQQRLLTILGYIGETYMDQEGNQVKPKISNFSLRDPKILREFKNKKFSALPEKEQDKILDFELFVVTIDEKINPGFEPIDLFIRLNDKPFPIKEHSFEMWNSWADKDIITDIKKFAEDVKSWCYIKRADAKNYRDRMENEEILLSISYLNYKQKFDPSPRYLDIYQRENRLNARIGEKKDITNILNKVTGSSREKERFAQNTKDTFTFIKKLRTLLIDRDLSDDEIDEYLKSSLDEILNPNSNRYFRRTFQDFYFLWLFLNPINVEMLKHHRDAIREEVKNFFKYFKDLPEADSDNGLELFNNRIDDFLSRFTAERRNLRLTSEQVKEKISKQKNICPLSNSPIYFGDDIEIDHIVPLAIGGPDTYENLQVVHKEANRKKGVKPV